METCEILCKRVCRVKDFIARSRSETVFWRSEQGAVETPLSKSKLNIKLPAGIWALGFVSMFMDVSSEMIHALLPIYLVTTLGASTLAVGFIEGVAEAVAH